MEFASSGTAEIAYDVTGPETGRPVLLIHAGVNDRRSWRPLIVHLGEGVRCVAFDMQMFGETRYEFGPVRDLFLEMDRINELAADAGDPAETEPVWPRLMEIDIPTLVLTGRLDVERLLTLNPELARRLPNGRHEWLEGVGHVPHMEGDPAKLAAISGFLEEID